MSLQTPLLHDDELNIDDPPTRDHSNEEFPRLVKARKLVQRTWKRYRRYCLTIIIPIIILAFLLVIAVVSANEDRWYLPAEDEKLADDPRLEKYQTTADALFCADWIDTRDNISQSILSTASFTLSPETDLTFFLSRGGSTSGHFNLDGEGASSGKIAVEVVAQYEDTEEGRMELTRSKVCLAGQENEQGIMLWADLEAILSHIKFNISVHLPTDVRKLHDISTDFTNGVFPHSTKDILPPFGVVRMNARNASMHIETMVASSTFVQTSNAKVNCDLWSLDSAYVQTSNAPVFATLMTLGQHEGAETSVSVRTSNGPLTAFLATASDFSHTKFNASIHTSNGKLWVSSPRSDVAPAKSVFMLDASTSNAPAFLYLYPNYEGSFELETTFAGKAMVNYDPSTSDGNGRKRVVDMHRTHQRSHKAGSIYWDKESRGDLGHIGLRSTKKDVVIDATRA
ncbi:hypothetical protein VKT23_007277 [Stygiomarasmius scandens]|uniref:Uncharacterized protein n=1 Tax=Marasmiellus scandens TaxID=2682957 RepID=A0ABR1JQJ2_9AGAR